MGFPGGSVVKNNNKNKQTKNACQCREMRILSQGQEDPLDKEMALQYFCLGNPMDRGAWRATVYEVARVEHDLKTEQQQFNLLHNRNEHNIVKQLHFNCCCSPPGSSIPQAPLSLGFSRQEHWSRLPFPSPGDLPVPGIKPGSHIAGRHFTVWASRESFRKRHQKFLYK